MRHAVRWSRLWLGLVLVLAGVVWLVVDQRAGIVTQPYVSTPTPQNALHMPIVDTQQTIGTLSINVQLLSRVPSSVVLPARASTEYQEIAVLVVNRGRTLLRFGAGQLSLRGGAQSVQCMPLPGHAWLPGTSGVGPGSRVEVVAVAAVPSGSRYSEVVFTLPRVLGTGSVAWRTS